MREVREESSVPVGRTADEDEVSGWNRRCFVNLDKFYSTGSNNNGFCDCLEPLICKVEPSAK